MAFFESPERQRHASIVARAQAASGSGFWDSLAHSPHFARASPVPARRRRPRPQDTASSPDSPSPKGGIFNARKHRRRFRWAPRDSLEARLKNVGRPGSRRFIRWESEFVLVRLLSDTESDMSEDELDYDSTAEPSPGFFGELFYQETGAAFDPLVDTTEELQEAFLERMARAAHQGEEEAAEGEDVMEVDVEVVPSPQSASDAFRLLSRRHRCVLRRHRSSPTLEDICQIVHEFAADAQAPASRRLTFAFPGSFERLLVHAVAEFYALVSYTRDQPKRRKRQQENEGEEGEEEEEEEGPTTVVRRRKQAVEDEEEAQAVFNLIEYLRGLDEADDEMDS